MQAARYSSEPNAVGQPGIRARKTPDYLLSIRAASTPRTHLARGLNNLWARERRLELLLSKDDGARRTVVRPLPSRIHRVDFRTAEHHHKPPAEPLVRRIDPFHAARTGFGVNRIFASVCLIDGRAVDDDFGRSAAVRSGLYRTSPNSCRDTGCTFPSCFISTTPVAANP
jgi:hypothetical protein